MWRLWLTWFTGKTPHKTLPVMSFAIWMKSFSYWFIHFSSHSANIVDYSFVLAKKNLLELKRSQCKLVNRKSRLKKCIQDNTESQKLGMCAAVLVLVSDITGTKCAEVLFLGTASVGTGWCTFDRYSGSAASHPSTPPHFQDSAADVHLKKKSSIVSSLLCGAPQPMHHFRFNHWKLLISSGEQQPLCHGEGTVRLSDHLSWYLLECAAPLPCLHCVIGQEGSQEEGVCTGFVNHLVGHRVCRNVFNNSAHFQWEIIWSQLWQVMHLRSKNSVLIFPLIH